MGEKTSTPVNYNDKYFRIVLALIASHIIVMYDEPDGFFHAVFTASYWRGIAGSFVIAMALTTYIHFVTVRLDTKLDWKHHNLLRLLWQSVFGFFLPAIAAFLLAAGFFAIYGINILRTTYLQEDYTIILLMLLVLNVYYFGLNSYLLRDSHHPVLNEAKREEPVIPTSTAREILIVDTPTRSIPVKLDTAVYFFISGGSAFMRTNEMQSINDSHRLDIPLKALEEILDKRTFFRINRQMIVNFNACKFYKPGKNKTLELFPEPELYAKGAKVPSEHERLHIISEDRVAAFKSWMDR